MKLLLAILFLLVPQILYGAVAYDNAATATGEAVNVVTISGFTVAATNPLILCTASAEQQTISGVTYNSVAMTAVGSELDQFGDTMSLFQLTGQSGTHDAVFTFTGLCASDCAVACASFTGVDQTTPIGTVQTSFDYDSLAISLTVPAGGLSFDAISAHAPSTGCTDLAPSSGAQIERFDVCADGTGTSDVLLAGSTRSTSGVHQWPSLGGELAFQIGVPINQATAAVVTRRRVIIVQ